MTDPDVIELLTKIHVALTSFGEGFLFGIILGYVFLLMLAFLWGVLKIFSWDA